MFTKIKQLSTKKLKVKFLWCKTFCIYSILFVPLTFSHHGHSYRHSHELALGPHVGVDTHPLFSGLAVKRRHRRVMGHLLGHKSNSIAASRWLITVLRIVGAPVWLPSRPLVRSHQRFDFVSRHFPGAVKGFPQHGVVWLLGHSPFPPLVEGRQVVLYKADYPVLSCGPCCDRQEHVGVGHEVGIHLEQWALFQNEGRQHHLTHRMLKGKK